MTADDFPDIRVSCSRLSRLAFSAVSLALVCGGVGAVLGLLPAAPDQRNLQIVVGLLLLAGAAGLGFVAMRMFPVGGAPVPLATKTMRYVSPTRFVQRTVSC